MIIQVQALANRLTTEELRSMIPAAKWQEIKGKGVLQAYTLAHEGVSTPRIIGEGAKPLTWPRAVIEKLSTVVKAGTKFFTGHNADNSTSGREALGEVVASVVKNIGGKMSNIVVGHFPDADQVTDYDVVSMEADVYADSNIVEDIKEITGIAMASSHKESPAFPGAVRLAAIQCFGEETLEKGEKKIMTFDDVKRFVQDHVVKPWQLFNEADLRDDKKLGKIYEDFDAAKMEIERITKEKEVLEESSKDAIKKIKVVEARETLTSLTKDGLTDKQREFITARFDPEKMEDLSESGLRSFVESEKKSYSEMAKLFGGAEEKPAGTNAKGAESNKADAEDPVDALLERQ